LGAILLCLLGRYIVAFDDDHLLGKRTSYEVSEEFSHSELQFESRKQGDKCVNLFGQLSMGIVVKVLSSTQCCVAFSFPAYKAIGVRDHKIYKLVDMQELIPHFVGEQLYATPTDSLLAYKCVIENIQDSSELTVAFPNTDFPQQTIVHDELVDPRAMRMNTDTGAGADADVVVSLKRSVGEEVHAIAAGWSKYRYGRILRVNADGTYNIRFSDHQTGTATAATTGASYQIPEYLRTRCCFLECQILLPIHHPVEIWDHDTQAIVLCKIDAVDTTLGLYTVTMLQTGRAVQVCEMDIIGRVPLSLRQKFRKVVHASVTSQLEAERILVGSLNAMFQVGDVIPKSVDVSSVFQEALAPIRQLATQPATELSKIPEEQASADSEKQQQQKKKQKALDDAMATVDEMLLTRWNLTLPGHSGFALVPDLFGQEGREVQNDENVGALLSSSGSDEGATNTTNSKLWSKRDLASCLTQVWEETVVDVEKKRPLYRVELGNETSSSSNSSSSSSSRGTSTSTNASAPTGKASCRLPVGTRCSFSGVLVHMCTGSKAGGPQIAFVSEDKGYVLCEEAACRADVSFTTATSSNLDACRKLTGTSTTLAMVHAAAASAAAAIDECSTSNAIFSEAVAAFSKDFLHNNSDSTTARSGDTKWLELSLWDSNRSKIQKIFTTKKMKALVSKGLAAADDTSGFRALLSSQREPPTKHTHTFLHCFVRRMYELWEGKVTEKHDSA
jgi:hypothetical protein